jgi:hypothetical protein
MRPKELLRRYQNVDVLSKKLASILAAHEDRKTRSSDADSTTSTSTSDLVERLSHFWAGLGWTRVPSDFWKRFAAGEWNVLTSAAVSPDNLFVKATGDRELGQRYCKIGHQGVKGMMHALFQPDLVRDARLGQYGDDGTADLSQYLAGAGLTEAQLGPPSRRNTKAMIRLHQLADSFERDGEPEMFAAFVYGYVASSGQQTHGK